MATVYDLPSSLPLRRLRSDEFQELGDMGYFEDERVELLEGLIVQMSPISPPHAHVTTVLHYVLGTVGPRAVIRTQLPLRMGAHSQPQPDIALVAPRAWFDRHPDEAFLVVEVSVTSLALDRGWKGRIYAQGGVPEYWIVDVDQRLVEVHTDPGDDGYRSVRSVRSTEEIQLVAFPDVVVAVRDLFPEA